MKPTDLVQHYINHWQENIDLAEGLADDRRISVETRQEFSVIAAERRRFVSDLEKLKRELEK